MGGGGGAHLKCCNVSQLGGGGVHIWKCCSVSLKKEKKIASRGWFSVLQTVISLNATSEKMGNVTIRV